MRTGPKTTKVRNCTQFTVFLQICKYVILTFNLLIHSESKTAIILNRFY